MSEQQVMELLNRSERELDWLSNNINSLKEKYDQKVIAIKDEKVVAVGILVEDVLENLRTQGIDASQVIIKFISKIVTII